MRSLLAILIFVFIFSIFPTLLLAEERLPLVNEGDRPVFMHEARPGVPLIDEGKELKGILYRGRESEIVKALNPQEPYQRKQLTLCTADRIRRKRVGPASLSPESILDVVIHPPEYAKHAERWPGATIEYRVREPYDAAIKRVPALAFLLTLDIRCIPARAQMISDRGSQFLEIREGAYAWKK